MNAMVGRTMPKRPGAGRPRQDEGDRGTRQVRVFEDIADMIAWIVRLKGGSSAQVIDPLVRPQILARYAEIKADVERIKKAEDHARRLEAEAKERQS